MKTWKTLITVLSSTKKPKAWLAKAEDNDWSSKKLIKEIEEAYKEDEMVDETPVAYRCPVCFRWRLKGLSGMEVCRGHYTKDKEGNLKYE